MQVSGKTLRRGVTFIAKGEPDKRYVVAMFHKDNEITYISEKSFEKFINGRNYSNPQRVSLPEFRDEILDHWVESKREKAKRDYEDRLKGFEANRQRDEDHELALKMDLFYSTRNSTSFESDIWTLVERLDNLLKDSKEEGSQEGYEDGYRNATFDAEV